ncbi:hypothetical protein FACS189487_03940 [Campylobacterota bacterium]|nr:hypothetical protein FACS189487_03940 [Campylobacterota bacterium]
MKLVLFALFCLAAFADDFIVSYRGAAKNHTIVAERLQIARAMTPFALGDVLYEFDLEIDDFEDDQSVEKLLKTHQDSLLKGLLQNGAILSDAAQSTKNGADSKSVLTLKATKISAKVKENMVRILVFKN